MTTLKINNTLIEYKLCEHKVFWEPFRNFIEYWLKQWYKWSSYVIKNDKIWCWRVCEPKHNWIEDFYQVNFTSY